MKPDDEGIFQKVAEHILKKKLEGTTWEGLV